MPFPPLKDLRDAFVQTLEDKQAIGIKVLEGEVLAPLALCFILASASSLRHLDALCTALRHTCRTLGIRPAVQGQAEKQAWIVVDVGSVMVHLFLPEAREYYKLEELWDREAIPEPSSEE